MSNNTPLVPFNSTEIWNNTPNNDPSKPYPLDTNNLDKYPVYVRLEPARKDEYWGLGYASVEVNPTGEGGYFAKYEALGNNTYLFLSGYWGKYCYLHKV